MAQRDKNGETASQRIARKTFEQGMKAWFKDANTQNRYGNIYLYGTKIAEYRVDSVKYLFIVKNHDFVGSRLTKERKQALINEANKRNVTVKYV